MPCYEPRRGESGVSHSEYGNARDRADWAESSLCAILSELERRGLAGSVLASASRNGLIDVVSFWAKHSKSDEARIAQRLHEFSVDEQAIIKNLLNK